MAELPTPQALEAMTRAQLVATYDALRPTNPQLPVRPIHGRGNFTVNIKGALMALVMAPPIPIVVPATGNLWIPPALPIVLPNIPQVPGIQILPVAEIPHQMFPPFIDQHIGREQFQQHPPPHYPQPPYHGNFLPPNYDPYAGHHRGPHLRPSEHPYGEYSGFNGLPGASFQQQYPPYQGSSFGAHPHSNLRSFPPEDSLPDPWRTNDRHFDQYRHHQHPHARGAPTHPIIVEKHTPPEPRRSPRKEKRPFASNVTPPNGKRRKSGNDSNSSSDDESRNKKRRKESYDDNHIFSSPLDVTSRIDTLIHSEKSLNGTCGKHGHVQAFVREAEMLHKILTATKTYASTIFSSLTSDFESVAEIKYQLAKGREALDNWLYLLMSTANRFSGYTIYYLPCTHPISTDSTCGGHDA